MSVTILLPDQFPDVIWPTPEQRERRTREALALDLYREGKFSLRRVNELAVV